MWLKWQKYNLYLSREYKEKNEDVHYLFIR